MFKTVLGALAAATLVAAPAAAQTNANFVGPRIEVNGGFGDVDSENLDYGFAVGGDATLSDRVTLGAAVETRNTFDDDAREFGANARLGYAVNPNALVYATGGYSRVQLDHAKDLEGPNAGVGAQLALTNNIYTGLEYRYTRFEDANDRHSLMASFGLRF